MNRNDPISHWVCRQDLACRIMGAPVIPRHIGWLGVGAGLFSVEEGIDAPVPGGLTRWRL